MYWKRTAWAPKARRPTLKTAHVRPSSLTIWSNHFLCSLFFQCSNFSNFPILLFVHMEQVLHQFCSATPPSLMVLLVPILHEICLSFPKKYLTNRALSLFCQKQDIDVFSLATILHCQNSDISLSKCRYCSRLRDSHFFHPECKQPLRLPLGASKPFVGEAEGDPALGALW